MTRRAEADRADLSGCGSGGKSAVPPGHGGGRGVHAGGAAPVRRGGGVVLPSGIPMLTNAETADFLGIHPMSAVRLRRGGKLTDVRIGMRSFVPESAAVAYRKAHPQRRPQWERVAEGLRKLIAAGQPGDRLPGVHALAAEYGTSITPPGNAYRRLEAEGLVLMRPGRGFFVREPPAGGLRVACGPAAVIPGKGDAAMEEGRGVFEVDVPKALEWLCLTWGDAYEVSFADGMFTAVSKDAGKRAFTGETPDNLVRALRADWARGGTL